MNLTSGNRGDRSRPLLRGWLKFHDGKPDKEFLYERVGGGPLLASNSLTLASSWRIFSSAVL